jgi:4-hydroxy-2-oxovalerate/4-hydroxy-2-oxohexanoate aldolase
MKKKIKIVDVTLRDGMHPLSHKITPAQMAEIAAEIDKTGVHAIEFGHGNGLGGSSCQYGFGAGEDVDYIEAVSLVVKNSALDVITLPGIGTRHHLHIAAEHGVRYARFATQMTEADISEQHIMMAKDLGLTPIGGLTCAQPISIEDTVFQASLMESYGAEVVYLYDGSGYMLPQQVFERIKALTDSLNIPIGFHAHNNLQLAVANSMAAVEAGAEFIDVCSKGFGAGAGNCPTEPFIAVCERLGIETGVDLYKIMDLGDKMINPIMLQPMELTNDQIMLGYAGVYSSFLLFSRRAGQKYGVDTRDIIREIGRRQCTEGQENICIEVAYDFANGR